MSETPTARVDRALDLIHAMGLSPADLLIRQRELSSRVESDQASRARANEENKITNNSFIELESEQIPTVIAQAIKDVVSRDMRLTQAGTQRLWQDFRAFNLRKGKRKIEFRALLGFLRVWEDRLKNRVVEYPRTTPAAAAKPTGGPVSNQQRRLQKLASPAPFANRHFHRSDLTSLLGETVYRGRVRTLMEQFACSEFQAQLAVHGEAVRAGEISP